MSNLIRRLFCKRPFIISHDYMSCIQSARMKKMSSLPSYDPFYDGLTIYTVSSAIGFDLIPEDLKSHVHFVGGFVSTMLGVSRWYGDIDVVCTHPDAFYYIMRHLHEHQAVDKHVETKWPGVVYGYTVKFLNRRSVNIDLILAVSMVDIEISNNHNVTNDIYQYIRGYDMNWCMCAYSLKNEEIIYHPDILKRELIINSAYPLHRGSIASRIPKYIKRRNKTPSEKNIDLVNDYVSSQLGYDINKKEEVNFFTKNNSYYQDDSLT